jgi:hypothetical protein
MEVLMSATAQLSKLAELRAKTDRELVRIIVNAVGVGLLLTANEPDVDPAGLLHRRAADIYANTVVLVDKVENVRERLWLEGRLEQLRESLERSDGKRRRPDVGSKVATLVVTTRSVSAPAASTNMNAADPTPLISPTRRWDTTAPTK